MQEIIDLGKTIKCFLLICLLRFVWTLSRTPYFFLLPHPIPLHHMHTVSSPELEVSLSFLWVFVFCVFFVHLSNGYCMWSVHGFLIVSQLLIYIRPSILYLDDNWLCVLASLQTARDHWINCSQESVLEGGWRENKQKSLMPIQN